MKAFAINAYNGPLTLHDVAEPVAAPGQVVIAIRAASVNPVDLKVMEGMFKLIQPYKMPLIMGHDCAGVVDSVGAGVTDWAVGDEIFVRPDEKIILAALLSGWPFPPISSRPSPPI